MLDFMKKKPKVVATPLCDECLVNPRTEGFNYCSRDCGKAAQAKLKPEPAAVTPLPARSSPLPPKPILKRPNGSLSLSGIEPTRCLHCNARPKLKKTDSSGRTTTYDFCGKHCREANKVGKKNKCRRRTCGKWCVDRYCNDTCAVKSVTDGEVVACPQCWVMPPMDFSTYCSSDCENLAKAKASALQDSSVKPKLVKVRLCRYCHAAHRTVKIYDHCSRDCAVADDDPTYGDESSDEVGPYISDKPMTMSPTNTNPNFSKTYYCCYITISSQDGYLPPTCPICDLKTLHKSYERLQHNAVLQPIDSAIHPHAAPAAPPSATPSKIVSPKPDEQPQNSPQSSQRFNRYDEDDEDEDEEEEEENLLMPSHIVPAEVKT